MALDDDELKKRRQKRLEQRRQRQNQNRALWLRLIAAAAVLAVCGAAIFILTRSDTQTGSTPQSTEPPRQTQQETVQSRPEETEPQTTEPTTVIHIAAAGDLNITDNTVAAGGNAMDYTQTFLDVLPALSRADLTVLNLEGTLCGAPYGSDNASAPQSMMTALRSAGVDLLQTANSCILNNGISGLSSTLQGIRAAGMEPVGAFSTNDEFKESGGYTIVNVQGVRVAFVAFTKGMDSRALPAGSEDCVNLLYKDYATTYQDVDTAGITRILSAVEKEKPDITIALLHWGSEYNDQISPTQNTIRNLMLNNGVDAIIGTHSHYVQKLDYDPEAGTLVAYSLGDFFSDGELAGTTYSIILELEITKDNETGETRITGFDYTPTYSLKDEDGLRVVRLREAVSAYEARQIDRVSKETYEDMKYALTRVEERLFPDKEQEEPAATE